MSKACIMRSLGVGFFPAVFLLIGCTQDNTEHTRLARLTPGLHDISRRAQKVPADIFPAAVVVKPYFGNVNLTITKNGKVVNGPIIDKNGQRAQIYDAVDVGEALTPSEVSKLRHSIFFAPEPDVENACIISLNYAFVFYDASDHFLGYFAFSLAPKYAEIYPPPHTPDGLTHISWNEKTIENILKAQLPLASPNHC